MRRTLNMPEVLRESTAVVAESSVGSTAQPITRNRLLGWRLLPWYALGGLVVVLVVLLFAIRQKVPVLTPASLAAARSQWRAAGVTSYEMNLSMKSSGLRPADVRVLVQDGRVSELHLNGEPASSGEPSSYTVEGLLELLAREIELAGDQGGSSERIRPALRARFDAVTGMPMHFLRSIPGSNRSTEWRVMEWHRLTNTPSAREPSVPSNPGL